MVNVLNRASLVIMFPSHTGGAHSASAVANTRLILNFSASLAGQGCQRSSASRVNPSECASHYHKTLPRPRKSSESSLVAFWGHCRVLRRKLCATSTMLAPAIKTLTVFSGPASPLPIVPPRRRVLAGSQWLVHGAWIAPSLESARSRRLARGFRVAKPSPHAKDGIPYR